MIRDATSVSSSPTWSRTRARAGESHTRSASKPYPERVKAIPGAGEIAPGAGESHTRSGWNRTWSG
eukprot:4367741-Pyramimonas_sp.AAC.1